MNRCIQKKIWFTPIHDTFWTKRSLFDTTCIKCSFLNFFAGWIGGLGFGIMFAASPISTGLFKKFGHRIVAIVGTILCSVGLLASSFVPSPHLLFLTYSLLMGVGSNFVDNTTLNLVGSYFPRKNSARSTCFATLGWSIGNWTVFQLKMTTPKWKVFKKYASEGGSVSNGNTFLVGDSSSKKHAHTQRTIRPSLPSSLGGSAFQTE